MKSKVDKFDVDKLLPVPADVVKNDVVKKDIRNDNIKNIIDKIPDITNLATTAALTSVESRMPIVSHLVKKSR